MEIFYHNFKGELRNPAVPELLRARHISLRAEPKPGSFRIKTDFFLAVASFSCSEKWRFAGESSWSIHQPGKITLFRPGCELEMVQIPGCDRHGMMMQFVRGEILGIDRLFAPGENVLITDDTDGELYRIIREIAQLPPGSYFEAQTLLFQWLSHLHCRRKKNSSLNTEFADNVDNLLLQQLNHPLSRSELAQKLNVSVSSLSHRYLRERGIPVIRRHLEMRLMHARAMLLNSATVVQCAAALGFSSPFHLSRAFRQYYGITPAGLKKSVPL